MNRTSIQSYEWEWIKCSIHYITILWCTISEVFTIHIWYSPLRVCCMSFWTFLLVAKGPVSVSLPLRHDCRKWTSEWKLHFAIKWLARKWYIKRGKMNQVLWLALFFKTQKLIGCGITTVADRLSPSPMTYTSVKMTILLYLHFWGIISSWA